MFKNKVLTRYSVLSASGVIKTKEPIKITWKISSGMMIIEVDGKEYATIDGVNSVDDVDARFMNDLTHWINETYYSEDYKSSAYIPPMFKVNDFGKQAHAKVSKKLEDTVSAMMENATFLRAITDMIDAAKAAIRVGHMQNKPNMVKFNALAIPYLEAIHKKDLESAIKAANDLVEEGHGEAFGLK